MPGTITQAFIDLLTPTVPNLWGGLLTANPRSVQDPLTIELISRIYARPEARFNGVFQDMLFPGIAKGATVAAVGLFDAEVNGELRYAFIYDEPYTFSKGGYLQVPGSSLSLGLGSPQAAPSPPPPQYAPTQRSDAGLTPGATLTSRLTNGGGCSTYPSFPVIYESRPALSSTVTVVDNTATISFTKTSADTLSTGAFAVIRNTSGCLRVLGSGVIVSPDNLGTSFNLNKLVGETFEGFIVGRVGDPTSYTIAHIYNGVFI